MGGLSGVGPLCIAMQVVHCKTARQRPCRLDCDWCSLVVQLTTCTAAQEVLRFYRGGKKAPKF